MFNCLHRLQGLRIKEIHLSQNHDCLQIKTTDKRYLILRSNKNMQVKFRVIRGHLYDLIGKYISKVRYEVKLSGVQKETQSIRYQLYIYITCKSGEEVALYLLESHSINKKDFIMKFTRKESDRIPYYDYDLKEEPYIERIAKIEDIKGAKIKDIYTSKGSRSLTLSLYNQQRQKDLHYLNISVSKELRNCVTCETKGDFMQIIDQPITNLSYRKYIKGDEIYYSIILFSADTNNLARLSLITKEPLFVRYNPKLLPDLQITLSTQRKVKPSSITPKII